MTQLRQEQVNASRTVQQVRSDIAQLQKLRSQVMDCDLLQFDSKVLETETRLVQTLSTFNEAAAPFQHRDDDNGDKGKSHDVYCSVDHLNHMWPESDLFADCCSSN